MKTPFMTNYERGESRFLAGEKRGEARRGGHVKSE